MEKENVVWLDVNNLPPRKRRKREIKRPTVEENERNITEWNRLHNLIVKNKLEGDFKKRCLDQKLTCPQPIVFKCEDDMIRKKYVRWNSEQIKLDELYYNKYRLRIAKETLHQASSSDI